jgi:hypothetical protein
LDSSFDASMGIAISFPARTSSSAPLGPSYLVREISCNVILFLLYQRLKKLFYTLILIASIEFIQGYPKTISTSSISIA